MILVVRFHSCHPDVTGSFYDQLKDIYLQGKKYSRATMLLVTQFENYQVIVKYCRISFTIFFLINFSSRRFKTFPSCPAQALDLKDLALTQKSTIHYSLTQSNVIMLSLKLTNNRHINNALLTIVFVQRRTRLYI